ncbi:efflux RND transporter periplasmic adaptor subunit [Prosthecobacter sp.]|uniref:efflux RND transporter periplasmic adaptor subunit n=1 Tax=Prosthecobacter sp. TaxID=1965333 RepID=UPI003784AF9C
MAPVAQAGPGHDHGDAAPVAGGNSPKRQPDGSVFLPKSAQRQLQVRTTIVKAEELPKVVELTARVVADPNAGGKVQPTVSGRIEPGPKGLPSLGAKVAKGEVLAYVRAAESATPELKVNLEQAKRKLARLEQLDGVVPQREIESVRIEVQSLTERLSSGGGSYVAREPLVAPVAGVIAAASVVAGQVVEPRELLFEIVDPARLQIEASGFDMALSANIESASASGTPGQSIPLRFMGSGTVLRDGALPIVFRTEGNKPVELAVGQPLKVLAKTRTKLKGHAVPASAVLKNPSNQDIVWTHTSAERFEPRTIRWAALDGANVAVLDGLADGARVVVQGAALLNQVR